MAMYSEILMEAIHAAIQAGREILKVYHSDFHIEVKADDSPLTLADKRSHEIIKAALKRHGIPVLSEEGRDIPYQRRQQWRSLWIIDPLDGTKEFIKRNDEFTVNIALVEGREPVVGVVYAPVPRLLYFAAVDIGAYKMSVPPSGLADFNAERADMAALGLLRTIADKLPLESSRPERFTIVGSRSHASSELMAFVEQKRQEKGRVDFIQAGSSLKICLVAEGAANTYPRFGPTMEWDTAAGQVVAACAGVEVYDYHTKHALQYNKPDLLNPWFVVERRASDLTSN